MKSLLFTKYKIVVAIIACNAFEIIFYFDTSNKRIYM